MLIAQPAAKVAVFGCSELEQAEAINRPETTRTSDLRRGPIVLESALPNSWRQVFAHAAEWGPIYGDLRIAERELDRRVIESRQITHWFTYYRRVSS